MSDTRSSGIGVSALDRAHAARLAGEGESALRSAVSILTASAGDPGAAWLVARLLADASRAAPAARAGAELVQRFIRRGDLPSACIAARLAHDAGHALPPLLCSIAQAFGSDSPRLADVSQAPPPLPVEPEPNPAVAELEPAQLLALAEQTLTRALAQRDVLAKDAPLPRLALFGALPAPALQELLGALSVREFAAGAHVVEQGAEGTEAFLLARGVLNVVRESSLGGLQLLAVLGPGAWFGEMALVSQAPRAASVVAVEPVQLLCASRAALEKLAARVPSLGKALAEFCHMRMLANLARHSEILSALEPSRRLELIARFTARSFAPGHELVRRGEQAERMFLIASGAVEVRGTDADGERVVLAQLGAGEVVGEMSLVLRRPAMADVMAVQPTVALELTREGFEASIRQYPGLLQQLYELASRRDDESRSLVAQVALDVSDVVLI